MELLTDFNLSRTVPNNASVVVTINGVVQTLLIIKALVLIVFMMQSYHSVAPAMVMIQVRHIGFASPSM